MQKPQKAPCTPSEHPSKLLQLPVFSAVLFSTQAQPFANAFLRLLNSSEEVDRIESMKGLQESPCVSDGEDTCGRGAPISFKVRVIAVVCATAAVICRRVSQNSRVKRLIVSRSFALWDNRLLLIVVESRSGGSVLDGG
jgi:hypothetical protein